MVPAKDKDYCVKPGTQLSDGHNGPFASMVDGSKQGIACNQSTTSWVGKTLFEIMAPSDVTELKITYGRPLYAPGWKIYRDGNLVLSEGSNRGGSMHPSPVTYSYTLSASGLPPSTLHSALCSPSTPVHACARVHEGVLLTGPPGVHPGQSTG